MDSSSRNLSQQGSYMQLHINSKDSKPVMYYVGDPLASAENDVKEHDGVVNDMAMNAEVTIML